MERGNNASNERGIDYYEHISPTALVPAYARTFTDIPYSREIYKIMCEMSGRDESAFHEESAQRTAPRYEARYKIVDLLLRESGCTNILEIAAGISPRGLSYISGNNEINFVELDLPHMSRAKSRIIELLGCNGHHGLTQVVGNALESTDLLLATQSFGPSQEIAVINEGLMRYFNFDEKRQLAENILGLLRANGGVWITPDISLQSFRSGILKAIESRVTELSGIDVTQNYFTDVGHAVSFFEDIGYAVDVYSFTRVADSIVSGGALGLTQQEVEGQLRNSVALVMKPKT